MVAYVYNIPNMWKREEKDHKLEYSLSHIVILKKWQHTHAQEHTYAHAHTHMHAHTPERIQPPNIQMSEEKENNTKRNLNTQKLKKTKNGKFW